MKKRAILPIVLTLLLLSTGFISIYFLYNQWENETIKTNSSIVQEVKNDSEVTGKDLKSIIHEAQKGVVQIEAKAGWGNNIGSGFLYNEKGDIITNAHVVKGAESIYVKTANARTYPAALIGIGKDTDIAVIRVPQLANRTPMEIEDNIKAEIGDEIIALGSPLGLQNTVTIGIVSGTGRSFKIDEYQYENAYQISAPITNGNSGGPLIHRPTGKVIAVNSAGTEQGSIGFSIPVADVLDSINMWSSRADNRELDYDGYDTPYQKIDLAQLEEDARYLVGYFYESLLMRDYINAYALLGSTWQSKTSYKEFREDYIHMTDITMIDRESEIDEKDQVHITLTTDNVIRNSDHVTITERYECKYLIGYENDQLKILEGKRTLISTTEHISELEEIIED